MVCSWPLGYEQHCAPPGAGGTMFSSMVSLGPPRPSPIRVSHELAHERCDLFPGSVSRVCLRVFPESLAGFGVSGFPDFGASV